MDRRAFMAAGSAQGLRMPAEEEPHAATWMCLPSRDVWGRDLGSVQATIAGIALAVAEFEPVRMLVRPDDLDRAADLVGSDVELIEAPVDDLWARDTLPLFLVSDTGDLAAGRVRFNGWGGKQVHTGDAMTTLDGVPYELVTLRQPDTVRSNDDEFPSSYVNYYVCNGAVIVPEFGDARSDGDAVDVIGAQYPDRDVVTLGIDPVAAGGGGIHCATQQEPVRP